MAPLKIVEQRAADVTILRLAGSIEIDDGDAVLRDHVNRLVEAGRIHLVLDLKDVVILDSTGIGVLVAKYLTVKRRGGTIKLLHLTDRTQRLLQITKLATVFEIFEGRARGRAEFQRAGIGGSSELSRSNTRQRACARRCGLHSTRAWREPPRPDR